MGLAGGNRPHPRAVIFDLDRCLIDSRAAWRYCIEESLAAAHGRKVDASKLIDEYHIRPWRDALRILAESPAEAQRCEGLCEVMFERSAMKKLLVHEGVAMALDSLRGERIELGAISRLPHAKAVKQVQSTGLDRFLAVLSATPVGEPWRPAERLGPCLSFLEATPVESAFVSGDLRDLEQVASKGLAVYAAAWAAGAPDFPTGSSIPRPAGMVHPILNGWARRPS